MMQVAACSASFTLVIRSYLYGSEGLRFRKIYQENHNIDWCYIVWLGLRSNFHSLFPNVFDMLLMGYADSGRILINDISPHVGQKAHTINVPRDAGWNDVDWSEAGLD